MGIDPGKNGGIVSLTNGKVSTIDAMPSNIKDLWNHFLFLGFPNQTERIESYVYMERVHSMPTDGVRSAYSFGYHNGCLATILDRLCPTPNLVVPSEWMASFNLKRSSEESKYAFKKRILETAKTTSGLKDVTLKTADAYLIALYGYQQVKRQKNAENHEGE